jgi:hypothetical protein
LEIHQEMPGRMEDCPTGNQHEPKRSNNNWATEGTTCSWPQCLFCHNSLRNEEFRPAINCPRNWP